MRVYSVILLVFGVMVGSICYAQSVEITTKKKLTPLGDMRFVVFREDGDEKDRIYLNNTVLIETEHGLSDTEFELIRKNGKTLRNRVLITEEVGPQCPTRYYILDFSEKAPIVSTPFDNGRCSEYDWVSWGKKNTVIMLKDGSKFIYENGKVRPAK